MPLAAARLGSGSDVLALDDEISQDHDWGLRLNLFVPPDMVSEVDAYVEASLPAEFADHTARFALTLDGEVRHQVHVDDVTAFSHATLGVDASTELSVDQWLSLTGQCVLEITAGPVFFDTDGTLTGIRQNLSWYPDDLWRYVVAVDWARLEQELPFVGRTGHRGDDLGSRVITARLAQIVMHLAFLLERRWPPYSKWLGAMFATLPSAPSLAPLLDRALAADAWTVREQALVTAARRLAQRQRDVALPDVGDPVGPFHDRPFRGIRPKVIEVITSSIADPRVMALPYGVGSAGQRSDNVNVLVVRGQPQNG